MMRVNIGRLCQSLYGGKGIVGIYQKWVVHQPFFCQFLGLFSQDDSVEVKPFFDALTSRFRYGSIYAVRTPFTNDCQFIRCQLQTTHVLDLTRSYEVIYQNYTRDRKINLRRAMAADWVIVNATNVEPLLTLFRDHHASTVEGGVADWAYSLFRKLYEELNKRGLVLLRYAVKQNRIEAGALFVCEGERVIYLFNAASPVGRLGNARTVLLDQFIREKAGQKILFDFESPIKQSICDFYQSFGTIEEPFYSLHWNRLNRIEKTLLRMIREQRIASEILKRLF